MRHNVYAHPALDRASELRGDDAWLRERLASGRSLVVPVWRSRSLVAGTGPPRAVMPRMSEARPLVEASRATALLGLSGGVACFAVDLPDVDAGDLPELPGGGRFVDLRSVGAVMDRAEAAVLAYARGILHWHARHAFCGVCGSPAESLEAGHLRRCVDPGCGAQHFPRTDPAVIMLVTRGDRALLGRKPEWAEGMYSALAGFVEPGESLEQAVAREVMEEAGIAVANIRYHSSQPWPFPSSLMLGFRADALGGEFVLNERELEDLRWFSRAEVAAGGAGTAARPRSDSIARRLIDEWVSGG